ncbi:DUF1269 domain-containing protein [Alkalimarinus coralli]|uniref:DUF1269 domain-containing protein n=1 Tax=Alkalimarinus coralli TaxID=2935863 RepID=UPI00202B02D9|nr:DUF1269 domain-containing protein [Alkalimarinus coralli]
MVRLYFLLPDVKSVVGVADELRSLGVDDHHMHLLSNSSHDARMAHVPVAHAFHVSDAWNMTKRGALAGLLCGFWAVLLSSSGMYIGFVMFMQGGIIGAGAGALMGAIIGLGRNEVNIEEHELDIEEGKQMLLVDVDKNHQYEVIEKIRSHHREVEIETSHDYLHF